MKGRTIAYSILLACGLAVLAFTSGGVDWARDKLAYAGFVPQRDNEDDPSRAAAIDRYDRSDHLVPAGATILLGDSIAYKAPFAGPCIANRGLGGERSDQLLANLDRWPSIDRAGAVVIAIGTNDVWQRRPERLGENVAAILARIDAPVFLVGLPAELDGIADGNAMIRKACRKDCTFVDAIGARAEDGIHLSAEGYARIAALVPLDCRRGG